MKKILAILTIALAVLGGNAKELRGRVVRVADGDTITVLDSEKAQHKIRLDRIDAPLPSAGTLPRRRISPVATPAESWFR